jgi:hypothetical protein
VKILFLIIVNVLGHPKGVGGLTSNFLFGGGMDVFWNDPISGNSLMPKLSSIQIKSRACNFCSDFLLLMDVNEWMNVQMRVHILRTLITHPLFHMHLKKKITPKITSVNRLLDCTF